MIENGLLFNVRGKGEHKVHPYTNSFFVGALLLDPKTAPNGLGSLAAPSLIGTPS
jgi:hypothetical protein